MLAPRQILKENFAESPWLRRRPEEGFVVFQLMARAGDPLDRILQRMGENGVEAIDLNLACDAMAIRAKEAGSALFENFAALRRVVTEARRYWPGILTAKVRLGSRGPEWQTHFRERVEFLEAAGVDALIVHPRFFEDKFARRAQHEQVPWVASLTRLPLVANGDLGFAEQVQAQWPHLQTASAIMIGRMAVARPWVFAAWDNTIAVDYPQVWRKLFQYVREDFPPEAAVTRIKMFTKYFAANYAFGHAFYHGLAKAQTLDELSRQAEEFFSRSPATVKLPMLSGL